jgi:hypothetical protein
MAFQAFEGELAAVTPSPAPAWPQSLANDSRAANDASVDALVPTLFHEHWWLEAATGGRWRAAEVRHGGRLVGWMPYVLSRRRGFTVSVMPALAHLLGPAIDTGGESAKTAWLRRAAIVRELIAQLPRVAHFSQVFHPGAPEVLAFQAGGFESFTQFSAELAAQSEGALWSLMRDKTRNVIRRAQEQCRVETVADPHEFVRVYERNLRGLGRCSYFDASQAVPLYEAAAARGQARIVGARSRAGDLVAAVFYVWDRRRMWYFLSTRDAQAAGNGAVALLVWQGIRMAAERGLIFDFDGIVSDGAARFYAGFGARFVPRFAVWRRSAVYALAESAIDVLRGRSNRNPFIVP